MLGLPHRAAGHHQLVHWGTEPQIRPQSYRLRGEKSTKKT